MMPIETSVSMVEDPCRAARNAARWNGSAAQVATGSARTATTHCHPVNCSGRTIESSTTGTASAPATRSRRSRSSPRSGVGAEVSSSTVISWPGAIEWPDSAIPAIPAISVSTAPSGPVWTATAAVVPDAAVPTVAVPTVAVRAAADLSPRVTTVAS